HLSLDDRQRIAAELLKANPGRSDRATAKIAGLSHPVVGGIRRDLEAAGDVEIISTRTDSAGRQQPARKLGDHTRILGRDELAQSRAEAPKEADTAEPVEAIGDRKDALRPFDDAVDFVSQRHAEVKAFPMWQRVQRVRRAMDALGVSLDDLAPAGRR